MRFRTGFKNRVEQTLVSGLTNMSVGFSMSLPDDDFDDVMDYYDVDSIGEAKDRVKEDMKNHIMEKISDEED